MKDLFIGMFNVILPIESHLTFKAGCMPRFTHGLDPALASTNRALAEGTLHTKQFVVILLAIRFSSINIEAL